jgi:hypothetical protein
MAQNILSLTATICIMTWLVPTTLTADETPETASRLDKEQRPNDKRPHPGITIRGHGPKPPLGEGHRLPAHRGRVEGGNPHRHMRPFRPDWRLLEHRDPEMFRLYKAEEQLQRGTRELVNQYRRAGESQRETIRKSLSELVESHFDVRQQRRQITLKRLQEELTRLQSAISRREQARKQIVLKHISQMLGDDHDLDF